MAVGDDAIAAGFPIVPNTGEEGRIRHGAREINRTRDFIAQIKALIVPVWPVDRGGTGAAIPVDARANLGISAGTGDPTGGNDGDIYFKIV